VIKGPWRCGGKGWVTGRKRGKRGERVEGRGERGGDQADLALWSEGVGDGAKERKERKEGKEGKEGGGERGEGR